jgi:YD repeat-containing protein
MRRYWVGVLLVGALLAVFLSQSSGAAFAGTSDWIATGFNPAALFAPFKTVLAIGFPARALPMVHHTPVPRRPMADYASRRRYARLIPKPLGKKKAELAVRPIDLVKLRLEHHAERLRALRHEIVARHLLSRISRSDSQGPSNLAATPPPASVTGIWPWWTYQSRTIPGVGAAMVNVTNLNFLFAENDVDISAGELDLSFSRVYNSESEHDATNDDNSTPSVYGNRWTNNLDAHLAWYGSGDSGQVSVYTGDGARDDYNCSNITEVETCTSLTPGIYDLLGTTDINGGVACQFQWTKKNGVSYMFNAPYAACGIGPGSYGRLLAIYGRNVKFSLQLAYSWNPSDSSPENLTAITVTHEPDGAQLNLSFATVAGSSPAITELATLTRPDNQTINYFYTTAGELVDVDKPGNNPILPSGETMPTQFLDTNPIASGNLPETYDIEHPGLMEVCGPRATISIIDNNPNSPTDGACVDFDYSSHQLSDWWTRGVLNPTPADNVSPSPIQTGGVNTGFVQWDDTAFFSNDEGSICNPMSEAGMQDAYGHNVAWCYNSNGNVVETSVATTSSASLTMQQGWDDNNDLISVTDPRGNITNIAYDANGNVVEVALPSQLTSQGTLRPTALLDYDDYNNLLRFCDPANNASNGWNPSQSDTLCEQSGSAYYTKLQYESDTNELYSCLEYAYTPSSYKTTISYPNGDCGSGLPSEILGTGFTQADTTNRIPTQLFTYNTNGTLSTYNPGDPANATWQLTYTNDGMNRVHSTQDPDGVTSYQCYNQDGTDFYSETAQQDNLDYGGSGPNCPTVSRLENGATPPPYATSYAYDADGDAVTTLNHHNCTAGSGNCTANNNATTKCNAVAVPAGMTCDYYDGLDRLVEVKQPYDTTVDLYTNPWITRYLYDLTGAQYTFDRQSFSAYGNLFETQELVPSTATVAISPPPEPSPGTISNPVPYQVIRAFAYDGADRPVAKYSASSSNTYVGETLTWDTSSLDSNLYGLLGTDCNSASPSQCQEFDYTPDGELKTFESSDNSSPQRGYTYDPDGRPTQITQAGRADPQQYTYDVNGNLATSTDANSTGGSATQATLTYDRYVDGTQEYLDVASGALTQAKLFSYSYRDDGPLQTEVINDSSVNAARAGKTTLSYTYTNAGRLSERLESGSGNTGETTIAYFTSPPTGLVMKVVTPVATLSSYSYSAENETLSVTPSGANGICTGSNYGYSLRGELTNEPSCESWTIGRLMANSLPLTTSSSIVQQPSYVWNDLMAILNSSTTCWKGECGGASWTYDGAGRMDSESSLYPQSGQNPYYTTAARTYDAENHVLTTTLDTSPGNVYQQNAVVKWGPDGRPIIIGTYTGSNTEQDERLHWMGDQLLFTTNSSGTLDDIKVDNQGDILPLDQGYNGLTFYDRGPGGLVMGCHNTTGTAYVGLTDVWMNISVPPCSENLNPGTTKMPNSTVWRGSPYSINPSGYFVGSGGTIGMPRPDGITDGFDTIQSVRDYDSMSGQWTTPDAYLGTLGDPASQKSYLWNNNDPVDNSDPSGYDDNNDGPNPEPAPPVDTGSSECTYSGQTNCTPPTELCGNKPCGAGHCDWKCQLDNVFFPSTTPANVFAHGDILARIIRCGRACMYAPLTGPAAQKCENAQKALEWYGEDLQHLADRDSANAAMQSVSSKFANPQGHNRSAQVEAEGLQAVASAPGLIDFYVNLYRSMDVKGKTAAENEANKDCNIPVISNG